MFPLKAKALQAPLISQDQKACQGEAEKTKPHIIQHFCNSQ